MTDLDNKAALAMSDAAEECFDTAAALDLCDGKIAFSRVDGNSQREAVLAYTLRAAVAEVKRLRAAAADREMEAPPPDMRWRGKP